MLCGLTGFPYNFVIYRGKESDREGPSGSYVVKKMLIPMTNKASHIVFFDNFFTNYQLLSDLSKQGIRAYGTIREKCIGHCPLKANKEIQKQDSRAYDF